MVWVVVRQNKENPEKVRVVHNGISDGKLFGYDGEQRAKAHAQVLNKEYRKFKYFAVELV